MYQINHSRPDSPAIGSPGPESTVIDAPVMLYDGVCGFCNRSVRTILKYDRTGTMRFAALQSPYAREVIARHPELANVDSVIVQIPATKVRGEQIFIRSSAALEISRYLGGLWKIALVVYILPRPVRDALYNTFARYRYRIFGKYDTCPIPAPEVRKRFMDVG